MPATAYLSLGSNLGDPEANLREAIRRLGELGIVNSISSFYETEPVEFTDQPWFINCAVELKTDLAPRDLLNGMLAIEHAMGRERIQPKGPRTIDLDILLYGDLVMHEHGLTIPHPAMHERRFVLEPLDQIAPNARHPLRHRTVRDMLAQLPAGASVKRSFRNS